MEEVLPALSSASLCTRQRDYCQGFHLALKNIDLGANDAERPFYSPQELTMSIIQVSPDGGRLVKQKMPDSEDTEGTLNSKQTGIL